MRQAIVTAVVGGVIAAFANWLDAKTMRVWLSDFSNGDVLAVIQIMLVCYLYYEVRLLQKLVSTHGVASRPRRWWFS